MCFGLSKVIVAATSSSGAVDGRTGWAFCVLKFGMGSKSTGDMTGVVGELEGGGMLFVKSSDSLGLVPRVERPVELLLGVGEAG